jgi:hypothetical protein
LKDVKHTNANPQPLQWQCTVCFIWLYRLNIKAVETQLKHTTVKQYKRERKPYKTDGALPLEGLGVSISVLHVFQQYFTYNRNSGSIVNIHTGTKPDGIAL